MANMTFSKREMAGVAVCLVLTGFLTLFAWDNGQGVLTLVSCLVVTALVLGIAHYGNRPLDAHKAPR